MGLPCMHVTNLAQPVRSFYREHPTDNIFGESKSERTVEQNSHTYAESKMYCFDDDNDADDGEDNT